MNDTTKTILEVIAILLIFGGGIIGGMLIKSADTTSACNEYWMNYTANQCYCSDHVMVVKDNPTPVWIPEGGFK